MNQGSTRRVQADQRAYGLAETGLSYAFSTLRNAANPYASGSVPATTVTLPTGTVTYAGTLSGSTWTLTGTGSARNPSGPLAANVVRTVSAQAQVTTTTQPDLRPWNYLFVDQPSACITLGNSVTLNVALYVRGNLCLTNNSQINSPAVHLLGNLSVMNSAQIGALASPISEFQASGTCSYGGSVTTCGPASRVYATTIGTTPPSIAKPLVDLPYWYSNADLGPLNNCTSGSFSGGFDTNSVLDVSRGSVNLTPAAAYDCRKVVGGVTVAQLKWQPGSPGTLTIKGTIYFDGNLTWSNLNLIQYDGRATIFASGVLTIANRADLCGVPGCDSAWDPNVDLLAFVIGSKTSATTTAPTSVTIGNQVVFQGAIYAVNDVTVSNNTTLWGPILARSVSIANSTLIQPSPVPISSYMLGLPAATQTVTSVSPVQGSYAG
jgi:hypothetical protein